MKKIIAVIFFVILFLCCFFITKALADSKYEFSPKMLREIKTMESRHFNNKSTDETNEYRLERLEIELMGRSFEGLPLEERMKTVKLASSKRMLRGVAVPVGMNKYATPKRLENNKIQIVSKNDDVGIIDGLLKVYAPELFESYREIRERRFERWSD
jgi:hypothetical protein